MNALHDEARSRCVEEALSVLNLPAGHAAAAALEELGGRV